MSANVANQGATFTITETKIYVPVVTLSTEDNAKLQLIEEQLIGTNIYQNQNY